MEVVLERDKSLLQCLQAPMPFLSENLALTGLRSALYRRKSAIQTLHAVTRSDELLPMILTRDRGEPRSPTAGDKASSGGGHTMAISESTRCTRPSAGWALNLH